jgi:hypothetical protein
MLATLAPAARKWKKKKTIYGKSCVEGERDKYHSSWSALLH